MQRQDNHYLSQYQENSFPIQSQSPVKAKASGHHKGAQVGIVSTQPRVSVPQVCTGRNRTLKQRQLQNSETVQLPLAVKYSRGQEPDLSQTFKKQFIMCNHGMTLQQVQAVLEHNNKYLKDIYLEIEPAPQQTPDDHWKKQSVDTYKQQLLALITEVDRLKIETADQRKVEPKSINLCELSVISEEVKSEWNSSDYDQSPVSNADSGFDDTSDPAEMLTLDNINKWMDANP